MAQDNFIHYKVPPECGPIRYTWQQDRIYRTILLLIPAGLVLATAGFFLARPLFSFGLGLWDMGVLGSAVTVLIWDKKVKGVILWTAWGGVLLQAAAMFLPFSQFLIPVGAGITAIGAAGIAGKEANCFAIREGWWLIPAYALTALAFVVQATFVGGLLLALTAILAVSFTVRKLILPFIVVDEE